MLRDGSGLDTALDQLILNIDVLLHGANGLSEIYAALRGCVCLDTRALEEIQRALEERLRAARGLRVLRLRDSNTSLIEDHAAPEVRLTAHFVFGGQIAGQVEEIECRVVV